MDFFIIVSFLIFSVGFAALAQKQYNFINWFIIMESLTIALNLIFTCSSSIFDSSEGEIFVIFSVAIAAAETAIGLSLYLFIILPKNKNNEEILDFSSNSNSFYFTNTNSSNHF